nr:hypothetical protein [Haemoproteus belopolskyi]
MIIYLHAKKNKTNYKTYKIIFYKTNKYNLYKLGIYNPKLNILSCIYLYLIKYLKQGLNISKNLLKIILYFIKFNKI